MDDIKEAIQLIALIIGSVVAILTCIEKVLSILIKIKQLNRKGKMGRNPQSLSPISYHIRKMKTKILLAVFLACSVIAWWASSYTMTCTILVIVATILNGSEWLK